MIGLMIVSHGILAEGMLDAVQLIVGLQENARTFGLKEGDSIDELGAAIFRASTELEQGQGVLILVDLLGASPFNLSARLAEQPEKVQVVTGFNLPMLLEVATQRESLNLVELAALARESGKSGIQTLADLLLDFKE